MRFDEKPDEVVQPNFQQAISTGDSALLRKQEGGAAGTSGKPQEQRSLNVMGIFKNKAPKGFKASRLFGWVKVSRSSLKDSLCFEGLWSGERRKGKYYCIHS